MLFERQERRLAGVFSSQQLELIVSMQVVFNVGKNIVPFEVVHGKLPRAPAESLPELNPRALEHIF